jgi:hypothetical protein
MAVLWRLNFQRWEKRRITVRKMESVQRYINQYYKENSLTSHSIILNHLHGHLQFRKCTIMNDGQTGHQLYYKMEYVFKSSNSCMVSAQQQYSGNNSSLDTFYTHILSAESSLVYRRQAVIKLFIVTY